MHVYASSYTRNFSFCVNKAEFSSVQKNLQKKKLAKERIMQLTRLDSSQKLLTIS